MEYKFTIHLSEDVEFHEKIVRKILSFYDSRCEDWFNFERFLHPGEAIEFYETYKKFPDIKIQDIDFTEIIDKRIPEIYREKISGVYEIEYLLTHAHKLKSKGIDYECFIIPFTGKLDDEVITEALDKVGCESKTIGKIKKITDSRLLKDEQAQLKLRVVKYLKEMARLYFKRLNGGQRKHMELIAQGGMHSSWRNYEVTFEDFTFDLRKMLVGFGDIDKMSSIEINKIILSLLDKSQIVIEFSGWWKKGEICHKLLLEYWNHHDYGAVKRMINLKAIDVILEILGLFDQNKRGFNTAVSLSKKNTLYKIGYKPKGIDDDKIFFDKLVARRVAIGLSCLLDSNFDPGTICSLITRGAIITDITSADDLIGPTFSTYLGLKRNENRIFVHRKVIMSEEIDFVNIYIEGILPLKYFLHELDLKCTKSEFFNDLSDFNEFIYRCLQNNPDIMSDLIYEINDILSDERFKMSKKALILATSLFL